jgi:adenylosuccinate lyase
MQSEHRHYTSPLAQRYASPAMSHLFSEEHKAKTWRLIWIYLADEQRKLGLPISKTQVKALERAQDSINLKRVATWEAKLKHDVMAHLKAFAEKAPAAEPILHLGATSAFITDNAEALIHRDALVMIHAKLASVLKVLHDQMLKYAALEMTGYTHFQPAQPVTLGKRLALWAQDLLADAQEIEHYLNLYRPLGCKGTTGTQASFVVLFGNDRQKVQRLDLAVVRRMGFSKPVALSGQTLSRRSDVAMLNVLAHIASSLSKLSYDMRLMQHTGEVREPFGKHQVGSSAMPYKQNPMAAERMTGMARFVITLAHNAQWTHAVQWLERSLDDSSNRRLVIPEAFLATDALCDAAFRILSGIRVDEAAIKRHLNRYREMFESEAMMMEETLKGGSRQELHEKIRQDSVAGRLKVKESRWPLSGAAEHQVLDFARRELKPWLRRNEKALKRSKEMIQKASV